MDKNLNMRWYYCDLSNFIDQIKLNMEEIGERVILSIAIGYRPIYKMNPVTKTNEQVLMRKY